MKEDLSREVIEQLGFTQHPTDILIWINKDKYWEYVLHFEGYAYVLYLLYRETQVPIHEFRNAETFKTFWNILTTYPSDEDEKL